MKTAKMLTILVVVLVLAISAIGNAQGKMYWTDYGTGKIQRANLDGSGAEELVTSLTSPYGIALDVAGGKMYWTDKDISKIQRANLDGSAVEDLVTGLVAPIGIALDIAGGKMYWMDAVTGKIQRANLDGSAVEELVTGLPGPFFIGLDVTGGKMYWTDIVTGKIQRANLDGSGLEELVTGLMYPCGIALDVASGKIYWTDPADQEIHRANLDGSAVEDLVTGLTSPTGIALDVSGGKIYWTDYGTGKIQRANLDGSGVEDIVTGLPCPAGIALVPPIYAFSYQGHLYDNNSVADGLYDFAFKLYDKDSDGNQVGGDVYKPDVDVIDGYFTVELDFGEVFNGDARWLEIGVRAGASTGSFTTLNPRQEVMPTPYAIYAKTAGYAETAGGSAGGITGSGTSNYIPKFTDSNTIGDSAIYESGGDIGISTSTPATKLEVSGVITATGGNSTNWNTAYGWGDHSVAGYLTSFSESDPVFSGSTASSITAGDMSNWNTAYSWGDHSLAGYLTSFSESDPQVGTISNNYVPKWNGSALVTGTIFDNGKVGIGTTQPGDYDIFADNLVIYEPWDSGITVVSDANSRGSIYFADGTSGADAYRGFVQYCHGIGGERLRFGADGAEIMSLSGGFVGIGTTTPASELHVYSDAAGGHTILKVETDNIHGHVYLDLDRHGTARRAATRYLTAGVEDWYTGMLYHAGGTPNWNYHIATGPNTTDATLTVLTTNGNVGIGLGEQTYRITEKLTVKGNILIRSESTGDAVMELGEGLDYAEGFDVADKDIIEPGSVLVIDADNPGKLTICNKTYDSKVAGIVTGAKGLSSAVRVGTEQFDYDVALAGRVYCSVDATEVSVEPGDLLTTSAMAGYAMKATDYMRAQGAILGKAMEKLEKGKKGQILVLVTLQ